MGFGARLRAPEAERLYRLCLVHSKAVYTLTILPDARTVRERFAAGCPCTHCVHCVGFVRYTETTSGGVRSGRERFAAGWRCSVNARVDAPGASGKAATHRLRMSAD